METTTDNSLPTTADEQPENAMLAMTTTVGAGGWHIPSPTSRKLVVAAVLGVLCIWYVVSGQGRGGDGGWILLSGEYPLVLLLIVWLTLIVDVDIIYPATKSSAPHTDPSATSPPTTTT